MYKLRIAHQVIYFDFLNLLIQSPNVCIRFLWGLFQLHYRHHWICVVHQHSNHSMELWHVHVFNESADALVVKAPKLY